MICYQSSRAMSNDLLNIFKFFVKKVRKRDYIWYLGVNAMRNECKSTDFFRFARANNIIMHGRVLACARVNGTPQDM